MQNGFVNFALQLYIFLLFVATYRWFLFYLSLFGVFFKAYILIKKNNNDPFLSEDSCIKLWDLRKLKNFKTIQLEEGYEVKDLSFDRSGSYLAVAGTDVRVFLCKQWNELLVMHDHTATATGVRFGDNARYAIIIFWTSYDQI